MKLFYGRHVKCFLRNSTVVEGIVVKYENSLELQSLDGESLLIIHRPDDDIILTKVLLSEEVAETAQAEEQQQFQAGMEEVYAEERTKLDFLPNKEQEDLDPMALQAKSITELRLELAKQERKIITEKLRDHHLGQVQKVEYGQPGFFKKPRT